MTTNNLPVFRSADKLIYPSWKALLTDLFEVGEFNPIEEVEHANRVNKLLEQLDLIRDNYDGFHPELASKFAQEGEAIYETGMPLREVRESMDRFHFGTNEFHTVYDIQKSYYCHVSDKVESVLGLEKSQFTVANIYGNIHGDGLHHPEDIYHVMRWGNLSYMVLSTPGFTFRANDDHYLIRHRLKTKWSSNETLRKAEYVLIEKRCYLCHDALSGSEMQPTMHLDRWTVLDNDLHHTVRPQFVTSPNQSVVMNNLLYLLNAALINIPVKFLLLLNERMTADRNKAVANGISEKLKTFNGIEAEIDDQQVADCFAKTIRTKMKDALQTWEPSLKKKHDVNTDSEAVKAAVRLGLLPIPQVAERLIYRGILEGESKKKGVRL